MVASSALHKVDACEDEFGFAEFGGAGLELGAVEGEPLCHVGDAILR